MLNKYNTIQFISLIFFLSSCSLVKPFLIKNHKKEEKKEKKESKKVEKKGLKENKNQKSKEVVKESEIKKENITKNEGLKLSIKDTQFARTLIKLRSNDYETFSSKTKMHFEADGQKQNFTANFRLEKNKIIWASISAYGIEVARAIITPDSVKAFERINKKAFLFSYHEIQKLINLEAEFSTLQDLIIGNAFATQGSITDVQNLGDLSTVFIKGNDFNNQITFNKSDSSMKQIHLQTIRAVSTSSLLIAFSDYERNGKYWLASKRQMNVQDIKGAAQLDMEIQKYEFDKPLEFPFSIPGNYKIVQ